MVEDAILDVGATCSEYGLRPKLRVEQLECSIRDDLEASGEKAIIDEKLPAQQWLMVEVAIG